MEHRPEPLNDLPIEMPTSGAVGLYLVSWAMVSRAQWHRLGSLLCTMCYVNLGDMGENFVDSGDCLTYHEHWDRIRAVQGFHMASCQAFNVHVCGKILGTQN